MNYTISVNGHFDDKVSVLDRGFLYGDSIYEVTGAYGKKLFAFEPHLERMKRNLDILGILPPTLGWEWVEKNIRDAVNKAPGRDHYVRWMITRGETPISLSTQFPGSSNLVVVVQPLNEHPEKVYQEGVSLKTAHVRRNSPRALPGWVKSGNYLNNILALKEIKETSFDDVLILDDLDFVTESSISNIFFIHEGELVTPPVKVGILDGITRFFVMKIAKDNGMPVREAMIKRCDLAHFEEAFLTSSIKGITPIKAIDGLVLRSFEEKSICQKIRKLYLAWREKELSLGK